MAEAPKFVVWLDRDGTIVDDPGYLSDPAALVLLPNVGEALRRLAAAGGLLVLVTNQSGIARGFVDRETVDHIHGRLQEMLAADGAALDHIEICPHWPSETLPDGELACDCRKPHPGMVLRARVELGLEGRSVPEFVVGDKRSDLELARTIGAHSILVRTGDGAKAEGELTAHSSEADVVVDDLGAAVEWILERMVPGVRP